MNKNSKLAKISFYTVIILLLGLSAVKFAGPSMLQLYIELGIGGCKKIPLFCMSPSGDILYPEINKEYKLELVNYKFPDLEADFPKGFTVVEELIKKTYYKKNKHLDNGSAIYLLYQKPGFFIELFPKVRQIGVVDNHGFLHKIMYSRLRETKNLSDAFFMILKGIFLSDLGNQHNVRMIQFSLNGKKGFISYNINDDQHYFDCDIVDENDGYIGLYIKDKARLLDLDKIFTIISTIHSL